MNPELFNPFWINIHHNSRIVVFIVLMLFIFPPAALFGQNIGSDRIRTEDLKMLVGNWTGLLTYLDYSSGNPFSLPVQLKVYESNSPFKLRLEEIFPNEPGANNKSRLSISKDGRFINKKPIKSRKTLSNGQLQIVAKYRQKDGNEGKMAINRMTYTIDKSEFSLKKEVQFDDSEDWITRSYYEYKRP
ncbi:hypothetical protein PP178_05290 [Zeaxanthinibacter sp. PT1]|uniref:hypothetical protein n=1 Tax=Zeaxanthinibacter TaxID=561554 RepID=UPI00234A2872|nr:hypothetical protein [Zeaxanthinibacter sp. PT1]MDC6350957.1 hypothetical protein [Zeaxanthinibacter sp. PT1]